MTACPRCAAPLDERLTEVGIAYICPKCQGRMVGMPVLRNAGASEGFLRSLWSAARREDAPRRFKCPHCSRPMSQVAAQARDGELEVDVCCPCNAVWFDRNELDRVAHEIPDSATATELPEKLNSVIWVRQGKDTLALGNITGAMVFQATFPVTVGILLTPWHFRALSTGNAALLSAGIALASGLLVLVRVRLGRSQTMAPWPLALGLIGWLLFVGYVFVTR